MKLKGINASSKKTILLIKKTFAELIEEKKEMNNITVTELVKKAGITRGAFYSHFDNIYEVASLFQEEIIEQVFDYQNFHYTKEDVNKYFDNIFSYLKANEKIYSKLLTADEAFLFMRRISKKIYTSLSLLINNPKYDLDIIFFTDGTINLIVKHFRKEISEDLDTICKFVKKRAIDILF